MTDVSTAPKPPPAWSAVFDDPQPLVIIATYGAQARRADDLAPFAAWFERAIDQPSCPAVVERARFTDAAGYVNEVYLAYWRGQDGFEAWAASDPVAGWWEHEDRTMGALGVWREVVRVPAGRLETILSAPTITIGSRRIADAVDGPITKNGYWGAMRDRLPVADHDPLLSSFGEELPPRREDPTAGKRIFVAAPENLALIRSGQDLSYSDAEELEEYRRVIFPVLEKGMDFLRDNAEETGCCSARFMREVDPDGTESARSFGFAWFLTLGHLERWSKSHPTHLAIYNRFSAFAQKRGETLRINLWHEVSVLPADGGIFEYVNCHEATGLLGFFGEGQGE